MGYKGTPLLVAIYSYCFPPYFMGGNFLAFLMNCQNHFETAIIKALPGISLPVILAGSPNTHIPWYIHGTYYIPRKSKK